MADAQVQPYPRERDMMPNWEIPEAGSDLRAQMAKAAVDYGLISAQAGKDALTTDWLFRQEVPKNILQAKQIEQGVSDGLLEPKYKEWYLWGIAEPNIQNRAIDRLTSQISGQVKNLGTSKYWNGSAIGELGGIDGTARHMASTLAARGITSIDQIGQKDEPIYALQENYDRPQAANNFSQWVKSGGAPISYDDAKQFLSSRGYYNAPDDVVNQVFLNYINSNTPITFNGQQYRYSDIGEGTPGLVPYVPTGETQKVIVNKNTGEHLVPPKYNHEFASSFQQPDGKSYVFSGTYAGKGGTDYRIQFDEQGLPVFYTLGGSTSFFKPQDLAMIAAIGSMAFPGIGTAIGNFVAGAAGLTVSAPVAAAIGSGILNTAITRDVKKGVLSAAGSLVGAQVADGLGKAAADIFESTAGQNFVKNIGAAGARAAVMGGDVEEAIQTAATGGMFNLAASQIPGFSDIQDKNLKALVADSINTALNGGGDFSERLQRATLQGAVSYGAGQVEVDGKKFSDLSPAQRTLVTDLLSAQLSGKPLDQALINSAIKTVNREVTSAVKNESQNQPSGLYEEPVLADEFGVSGREDGQLFASDIFPEETLTQSRDFTPDELRDLGLGGGDDLQRGSVDLTDLSGLESVFGPTRPAAPPAVGETITFNDGSSITLSPTGDIVSLTDSEGVDIPISGTAAEEATEPATELDEAEINRLLDTRLGDLDMLSEEDVSELMREELSKLDFATEEDIQAVIDAALEADPNLTEEDISRLLDDQLKELDIPTDVDIKNVVAGELDKLDLLSKEDVSEVVSQELAGLDFATAEDIQAAIDAALEANPGLSEDDISRLLDDQLKELDIPTDVDIRNVVSGELGKLDLLSETEVSEIISQELSGLDFASAEDVQAAIDAALEANPNLSEDDISRLLDAQLKELDIPTDVDIKNIVASEFDKLDLLSEEDVSEVLSRELAGLDFASEEDVQRAIDAALEANPNLSEDDISRLLDAELDKLDLLTDADVAEVVDERFKTIEAGLETFDTRLSGAVDDITTRINEYEAYGATRDEALDAAIDNVAEELGLTKDQLLEQLGETADTLGTRISESEAKFAEQIGGVKTELTGAVSDITSKINEFEAAGATRDEALDAAIGNVAEELGLTKDELLSQLGETEESLNTRITESEAKFAEQLAGVETGLGEQITGVKTELTGAIGDINSRIKEYEAYGATRDEALNAAIESVADELGLTRDDLLSQLGETASSLETKFQTGLTGLGEEVGKRFETVESGLETFGTRLTGAVDDITNRINEYEAYGATRDEALSAALDNVAEDLGLTRSDLLDQLGETQESLNTRISESEAKFAEQFGGLGEQVTGLGTQVTGLGSQVSGLQTGLGQLGTQVGQQVQGLQTGLGQLEERFSNQLYDLQGRLMQQAEQPIYNLPYYFQLPEQSEEEKFDITKAFSPTLYRMQKE